MGSLLSKLFFFLKFYEAGFEVQLSRLNALHHDFNDFLKNKSVDKNIILSILSVSVIYETWIGLVDSPVQCSVLVL